MAAESLHISLAAEPIFHFGGFSFTNSMFTSVLVSGVLILFALLVRAQLNATTTKPKGLQNIAEWIIESLYNLVHSVTGDLKKTSLFFPFVATFFLFILLNNWLGLLPGFGTILRTMEPVAHAEVMEQPEQVGDVGGVHDQVVTEETPKGEKTEEAVPLFRAGTADLNTTLALGIITVSLTQIFGFKFLHAGYLKKYFNFSSPIMFFVGLLELISEVGKILSFGFRLFGNVFAGEVLLTVIMFLVGVVVPMPFYALEIFVGFIQALVFAMLSLVFFNMATLGHDEHE